MYEGAVIEIPNLILLLSNCCNHPESLDGTELAGLGKFDDPKVSSIRDRATEDPNYYPPCFKASKNLLSSAILILTTEHRQQPGPSLVWTSDDNQINL